MPDVLLILCKLLAMMVAPAALVAAPVMLVRRLRFLRSAVPTEGVVVGSREERSTDGSGGIFELEVRYRVPDGREFTFRESGQRRHPVGAVVRVLYDPSRPERAHVEFTAVGVWVKCAMLTVAGAVFTLLVMNAWPPWSQ
ncbi:DUF3592 domain-containing protein [Actinomadura keratinilytica]|jgi:hypothetical protein|uniref:DUF3592 domain-containing protein n=1 Tax=Actinomadura keratinilytica TaxID=547461 RepID=A0ABP7Y9T5_9ACTN